MAGMTITLQATGIEATAVTGTITSFGSFDLVFTGKTFDADSYALMIAPPATMGTDVKAWATAGASACVVSGTGDITLTCTVSTATTELQRASARNINAVDAVIIVVETRSGVVSPICAVDLPGGLILVQNPGDVATTAAGAGLATAYQPLATLTAKGDIYAASASATVTRLGVGTDGYKLTADSTEPTGLKWVAAGAGDGDVVGPASSTDGNLVKFDGTTGKLIKDGGSAGTGDVVGPASSTDGAVATFDGATGKLLKDGVTLGGAAQLAVGTTAGTVAAGDDSRFLSAAQKTAATREATDAQNGLASATQIAKLDGIEASADVTDATNVAAAGAVMDADFTAADEIMIGTGAGTHGQVTLAASQLLGKKAAGAATNLTATEARAILNVADGADVTGSNAPQAHLLGSHTTDTLANLNAKVTDATLDDSSAARTPTAHAASHTDGTDDIQSATNAQKGVATAEHVQAIEANTAKVTNATHSGDVTGDGALTIANKVTMTGTSPVAITGSPTVIAGGAVAVSMAAATNATPGHATAAQIAALERTAVRFLRGTLTDPPGYQAIDTQIPIWIATDAAITITSIKVSCDADPTTELDLDLKFADASIGWANATLIDVCDTTAGVFAATSGFDDATVPSGKVVYFEFGAAPDAATLWFTFEIQFTYD